MHQRDDNNELIIFPLNGSYGRVDSFTVLNYLYTLGISGFFPDFHGLGFYVPGFYTTEYCSPEFYIPCFYFSDYYSLSTPQNI